MPLKQRGFVNLPIICQLPWRAFLPQLYQQPFWAASPCYAFRHCSAHLCSTKTYLEVLGRRDRIRWHYKYTSIHILSKSLTNKSHSNWLSFLALQCSLILRQLVKCHYVSASTYLSTRQRLENLLIQCFQQGSGISL